MPEWRPHLGGPCPVDEDSFPKVLTRSGEHDCERASDQQWEWTGEYRSEEVVAYCPENEAIVVHPMPESPQFHAILAEMELVSRELGALGVSAMMLRGDNTIKFIPPEQLYLPAPDDQE